MDTMTFRDICFAQKEDQKKSGDILMKHINFCVITWRNKETKKCPCFLHVVCYSNSISVHQFSGLCAQKTWKDPEAPRWLCGNMRPLTGKLSSGTWWHLTPTTANPGGHGLDSFPLTQSKSGLRTFTLYVPHPHSQYQFGLAPVPLD